MQELKSGSKVNLTNGAQAKVVKELGRGGQGIVYLVEVGGKQMALKWYLKAPDHKFYKNLEENITKGAPSDAFLWPEYLTKKEKGSYGYIMKLRPQGYYEFGQFLLAKKQFGSFEAMLNAAMKICEGFAKLHLSGLSYQDLNDGNFFIEPKTGDVLICDNDNVMPDGRKSGIMGKARYMAPEVVGGKAPDKYSDRFSLAVILFMLFYGNHPFEGARVLACPCMTESFEKKFYGSDASLSLMKRAVTIDLSVAYTIMSSSAGQRSRHCCVTVSRLSSARLSSQSRSLANLKGIGRKQYRHFATRSCAAPTVVMRLSSQMKLRPSA